MVQRGRMFGGDDVCLYKQKRAYEVRLSVVGSEMCIRDRVKLGIFFYR